MWMNWWLRIDLCMWVWLAIAPTKWSTKFWSVRTIPTHLLSIMVYFFLFCLISSLYPLVLACFCQLSASLTITLPEPVLEGTALAITCTTSGVGATGVSLFVNGHGSGITGVIQSDTTMRVFDYGTVDRSNSGTMFQCMDWFDNSISDVATLDVQCKWTCD